MDRNQISSPVLAPPTLPSFRLVWTSTSAYARHACIWLNALLFLYNHIFLCSPNSPPHRGKTPLTWLNHSSCRLQGLYVGILSPNTAAIFLSTSVAEASSSFCALIALSNLLTSQAGWPLNSASTFFYIPTSPLPTIIPVCWSSTVLLSHSQPRHFHRYEVEASFIRLT